MVTKSNISGYVKHLINGDYTPSIVGLVGIRINYDFILNSIAKDSQICEIGPGNGFFIDRLVMNGYKNITYVDLDDANVETLSEKYKKINTIKGFSDDGVNFLKNTNQKFDLIVSRQVLEHLDSDDVRSYFKYSYKCINKGGLLITETINSQNIFYGNCYRYIDSTHKNSFTEKSFIEYGGDGFKQRFLEFHNYGIMDMIKLHLDKKIYISYNHLLDEITVNVHKSTTTEINRESIIKRYYNSLKLLYYKDKSKRISRRYLQGIYPSSSVFTDHIISVAEKI